MNISALESGNFRLYLAGNLCAVNALWMLRVTVGWIAWDITESASFVGLISFLYFSPTIMAGPLFGVLTDRIDLRHAALTVQGLVMLLSGLLLGLYQTGLLNEPQLIAYATAAGIATAANSPVRLSLTPRLVDRAQVASVINIQAINFNLARMTGPALAGWLIATQGVGVTLLLTTLSYPPFLIVLGLVRIRPRSGERTRPPPFRQALGEGLRHVTGSPLIRHALVYTAIAAFFVRGPLEILPVLADGVFTRGASGLGLLTSVAGVGALTGGIVLAVTQRSHTGLSPHIAWMTALGLAAMIALGQAPSWAIAVTLVGVMAMLATLISIMGQTAIQEVLEDGMRGRVMSLWSVVAIGSAAAGSALQGLLADLIGFDWTMALGGMTALCLLGLHLFRHRTG